MKHLKFVFFLVGAITYLPMLSAQSVPAVRIPGDGLDVYEAGVPNNANANAIVSISGLEGGGFQEVFAVPLPDQQVALAHVDTPVGEVTADISTGWHGVMQAGGGNLANSIEISSSQSMQTHPFPFDVKAVFAHVSGEMEATFVTFPLPGQVPSTFILNGFVHGYCYGNPETNVIRFPGSGESNTDEPDDPPGSNAVSGYVAGDIEDPMVFLNASYLGPDAGWHIVTSNAVHIIEKTSPGDQLNQTVHGHVPMIPFFLGGAFHVGSAGIWETSVTDPSGVYSALQHQRHMVVDSWAWVTN